MGSNIRTATTAIVLASVACALGSACSSRPGEITGGANEESLSSCWFSVTKNTYAGSSYWGTITIKNDSSSSVSGFSVSFGIPSGDHCTNDTVPSGATLGPLNGSGTAATTQSNVCTFTWASTKLAAGASLTFNYSTDNTNFSAATAVTVSYSACTAGTVPPPPASSSSGSTSGSCSFGVTENSYDGGNYWGTLAFTNDGPSAATGYAVQFTVPSGDHCTNDTVPSGATLLPLSGSGTSATTTSNVCTFTWASATLAAGASVTFNYSTDNTDFSSASNVKVSAASCGSTSSGGGGPVATKPGKQLLMWVPTWVDWPNSLSTVTNSNPKIATMVSPDFYDFNANGNYASGPPSLAYWGSPTIAQVVQQVHAAGMLLVPLVYGGASNLSDGTDQGIKNVLTNSTTQKNFITAMVTEAQTQHYDGWNLDWEVGTSMTYSKYGAQYISFLSAFKNALNAQHMILTVDVAQWYILQCGGDSLVDLSQIGSAVDYAIIEDYVTDFGNPVSSCSAGAWQNNNCSTFGDLMNLMCAVAPSSNVGIGLDAEPGGTTNLGGTTEGTSPILPQALSAISAAGFTAVAVWPDGSPFLDSAGVPKGQTFVSALGQWLNH